MICEKCKELSQKSVITFGKCYSTSLRCDPYYDEYGMYHYHDNNCYTQHYDCSKGHSFVVTGPLQCPNCDWGKNKKITKYLTVGTNVSSNVIHLKTDESTGNLIVSNSILTEISGESQ